MTTPDNVPLPDDRRARLRASDADRELVHEILSAAMANGSLSLSEYEERSSKAVAAKTFGDLDALTDDLPVSQLGVPIPPASGVTPQHLSGQASSGHGAGTGRRHINNAIAVMSGTEIGGHSTVGDHIQAVAIMGGVEIDLREVEFTTSHVDIRCFALMGGIDITVPPELTVEIGGFAVMGGFGGKAAGTGAPDAPSVTITGLALMGGVEIKRRDRNA